MNLFPNQTKSALTSSRKSRLLLSTAILLLIATWLALHWPHTSFWYDEALTTWVATDSWQTLFRWCTQVDIQVPFHYILLRLWAGLAGDNEFAMRLLSGFCVILATAGIIAAGRRATKSVGVGIAAALLFGTMPGMIWLGYEVRAYTLGLALFAWATAFLSRLIDPLPRPRRRWLILAYGLTMIAALYTHYTALGGLVAHVAVMGIALLVHRSQPRRLIERFASSLAFIALGFAPWLPIMLTRGAADRSYYVGNPITPLRAVQVALGFKLFGREDMPDFALPFVIGYLILMGIGIIVSIRSKRWRGALIGSMVALFPVVITAIIVYLKPKLAGRYVWPAWIGFDLLVALAVIAVARWHRLLGVVAVVMLVSSVWLVGEQGKPPDSDFRAAYAYLCTHGSPDDIVALRDGTLFVVDDYYGNRAPCDVKRKAISLPAADMTNVEQQLTYPEAVNIYTAALANRPPSIWVVSWQGDIMESQALSYGLLDGAQHTVTAMMFGDVRLDRFEQPTSLVEVPRDKLIQPIPNGPTLLGFRLFAAPVLHAGDVVVLQAWWQRGERLAPDLRISAQLTSADGGWTYSGQVDQPPSSWKYVDDRWQPDQPVLGRYELRVGPDVPAGKAAIRIVIYDANGKITQQVIVVGEITVE